MVTETLISGLFPFAVRCKDAFAKREALSSNNETQSSFFLSRRREPGTTLTSALRALMEIRMLFPAEDAPGGAVVRVGSRINNGGASRYSRSEKRIKTRNCNGLDEIILYFIALPHTSMMPMFSPRRLHCTHVKDFLAVQYRAHVSFRQNFQRFSMR